MEKKEKTVKMIRQRKFLLVLPVMVLPFLTVFFWALGGGKMEAAEASEKAQAGFNLKLPDANIREDKVLDKMGYYDKAKQDSAKFQELLKNDPNYQQTERAYMGSEANFGVSDRYNGNMNYSINGSAYNNPNEEKIYQKLAELNKEMNRTPSYSNDKSYQGYAGNNTQNSPVNTSDVDRLEQMMKMMNQPTGEDREMQQLNGMLERILDIQHPDRVQEKIRQSSQVKKGQVYPVTRPRQENTVSVLENGKNLRENENSFFSLEENSKDVDQNSIQAVIHENQTLVNGSTVKLRLVNDVQINGVTIPKGNFIYGITSLNGERLGISIDNMRFGNSLFPVELTAYDLDGMDGIYIPGAITRDVAKQSADRSLQTIGMTSLDPSWEMQAAGAGLEAAKGLLSKKVKLVKVKVKAGYQLLLRDEKQKQNLTN